MALSLQQSWLPVVKSDGSIPGFFAITPTTFAGTESSFALSGGSVTIGLVQVTPPVGKTAFTASPLVAKTAGGGSYTMPVGQYYYCIAPVYSDGTEGRASPFVSVSISGIAGIRLSWSAMASAVSYNIYGRSHGYHGQVTMGYLTNTSSTHWEDQISITPTSRLPLLNAPSSLVQRQTAYMAATFTTTQELESAWTSYAPEFIPLSEVLPATNWRNAGLVNRVDVYTGTLIQALIYGMYSRIGVTPLYAPLVSTPTATWALTANAPFANQQGCVYFDFNWVGMFQAKFPNMIPGYIIPTAQPSQGDFKAFVISTGQVIESEIIQNTVRIVKVVDGNVTAGSRLFDFTIVSQDNGVPMAAPVLTKAATGGSLTGALVAPVNATYVSTGSGTLAAATYYVKIVAVDAFGNKTQAGAESTGVTTTGSTSSISYTWPSVSGAASYQIWYGTAPGSETAYYTSATNSYTLAATAGTAGTIPAANTTGVYDYIISSVNTSGLESIASAQVSTTFASGTTNSVILNWPAITGAASYNIYGRTGLGEKLLTNVTATTYTDTGVATPGAQTPTLAAQVSVTLTVTVS